jgi:hypothetical protein
MVKYGKKESGSNQSDSLRELRSMTKETEDEDAIDAKILEVSMQFIMRSDYAAKLRRSVRI